MRSKIFPNSDIQHLVTFLFLVMQLLLFPAVSTIAVPARGIPYPFVQPSGDTLMTKTIGGERNHKTITTDGWIIIKKNNAFYYATKKKCTPFAKKYLVKEGDKRSVKENKWLNKNGLNIYHDEKK